jgi:hypothetical protein
MSFSRWFERLKARKRDKDIILWLKKPKKSWKSGIAQRAQK